MEYKEYRRNNSLRPDDNVKKMQQMLNVARGKADAIVAEDKRTTGIMLDRYYFQKIHHRDYVPSEWKYISDDGLFGPNTEEAVKGFQKFLFITENGIMGSYTMSYLKAFCSLNVPIPKMLVSYNNIDNEYTIPLQEIESQESIVKKTLKDLLQSLLNDVIGSEKFQKCLSKELHDKKAFRDFAHWVQNKAVQYNPEARAQNAIIDTISKNIEEGKGKKGYYENSEKHLNNEKNKLNQIIRKIREKFKPGELAKKVSGIIGKVGKAGGQIVKWWDVIKSLFKFLTHLFKRNKSPEWEQETIKLFYDTVDLILIVVVTEVLTCLALAGTAALLGLSSTAGLPVLLVVIVSVLISVAVNWIFTWWQEHTGNTSTGTPLTLSIYDNVEAWINSLYLR